MSSEQNTENPSQQEEPLLKLQILFHSGKANASQLNQLARQVDSGYWPKLNTKKYLAACHQAAQINLKAAEKLLARMITPSLDLDQDQNTPGYSWNNNFFTAPDQADFLSMLNLVETGVKTELIESLIQACLPTIKYQIKLDQFNRQQKKLIWQAGNKNGLQDLLLPSHPNDKDFINWLRCNQARLSLEDILDRLINAGAITPGQLLGDHASTLQLYLLLLFHNQLFTKRQLDRAKTLLKDKSRLAMLNGQQLLNLLKNHPDLLPEIKSANNRLKTPSKRLTKLIGTLNILDSHH